MRVISGTARGTNLLSLDGENTRPTTDRIKETLFNMIQSQIKDSSFLDLYSGSGAIGIEALSRGSSDAVFIEKSLPACDIIKKNLTKTKLINLSKVYCGDVLNCIDSLNTKFDIIFMDPPYENSIIKDVLLKIKHNNILNEDAIIIVEQSSKKSVLQIEGFDVLKVKEFKTTNIVFYVLQKE